MKKTIEAFLREDAFLRPLAITGAGKPDIDYAMIERWQRLFNLIAKEAREPAALILRITSDSIRILFRSDDAQKNRTEYYFGNGLYCESIMGSGGLLITNAVSGAQLREKQIPQATVFTCCGLPIQWPDGELFAAICRPSHTTKGLKKCYKGIISELKAAFEQELASIYQQQLLLQTAETDPLTLTYNRRKIDSVVKSEFDRAKRYGNPFSVTIMDLNEFKKINDVYGHNAGDDILRAFVQSLSAKLRETDWLGRWGGDEFILVCPNTDIENTQQMITRFKPSVIQDLEAMPAFFDFCFGVAQYEHADQSYQEIIKRADEEMYRDKNNSKERADSIA